MNIAIVVDHLEETGGVERWVVAMLELFPGAHLFAPMIAANAKEHWSQYPLTVSKLQTLTDLGINRKLLVPFVPLAMSLFDFSHYDVVLSSHAWFATSILVPPLIPHVCYCHTPPRFLWAYPSDGRLVNYRLIQALLAPLLVVLRLNDFFAAQRVTQFVTNSENVARRIKKFYRREAIVVPCGYDIVRARNGTPLKDSVFSPGSYYLVVSRLVAYKNVDIAIEAANQLKLPLVVVGDGPQKKRLVTLAGPTVHFVGSVEDAHLVWLYKHCLAVIFPGEDDFGNVPIEAMQAGKPVIALAKGGAFETVIAGKTGVFFQDPTVESLVTILTQFDATRYAPSACRSRGAQFSRKKFLLRMQQIVEKNGNPTQRIALLTRA